jgi:hypothetical protein
VRVPGFKWIRGCAEKAWWQPVRLKIQAEPRAPVQRRVEQALNPRRKRMALRKLVAPEYLNGRLVAEGIIGRVRRYCRRDGVVLVFDGVLNRFFVLFLREAGGKAGTADELPIDDQCIAILALHIRIGCPLFRHARYRIINQVLDVLGEVLFICRMGIDFEFGVRFGLCERWRAHRLRSRLPAQQLRFRRRTSVADQADHRRVR